MEYTKPQTTIQLRGAAYKAMMDFRSLLEDDESKSEFQPAFDAFQKFEQNVQKILDQPRIEYDNRTYNREIFEFQDHTNHYTNPEIFLETKHEPTFLELSDCDVNIDEIAIFQRSKNLLILKNGFSIELTSNDAARVRHFLQTRRFK